VVDGQPASLGTYYILVIKHFNIGLFYIEGAAIFYVDFLVEHQHDIIGNKSGHHRKMQMHKGSSLDAGTTMSNQIIFDVFSSTIRAAKF
jgi:hypothetical protein